MDILSDVGLVNFNWMYIKKQDITKMSFSVILKKEKYIFAHF